MALRNFATFQVKSKTKATVDVQWVDYTPKHPIINNRMHGLLYTIGVGFCVARSDLMGNAKASKSGMSDKYRFLRFFYVLLSNVASQALGSLLAYIIMYMSVRKLNVLLSLWGLTFPVMAQSVDYSVVAVSEESGLDFKKITSDNDCLCMPEVKRKGQKITWWSSKVIAMSPIACVTHF